jgi:membrane carboxypeptidase/penicillin-binding protein PbpC
VAPARGRIEWSVDGREVGAADADAKVDWPLAPGKHRIMARDEQGRTAEARVVVR